MSEMTKKRQNLEPDVDEKKLMETIEVLQMEIGSRKDLSGRGEKRDTRERDKKNAGNAREPYETLDMPTNMELEARTEEPKKRK